MTFDIEPAGEMVKLTVIHDGFDPGSAVLPGISAGWPRILSDLKTLLEAGDTQPVRIGPVRPHRTRCYSDAAWQTEDP